MTSVTHVPALFGLAQEILQNAMHSRRSRRQVAQLLEGRVTVNERKHKYGCTEIYGWLTMGEPVTGELLALYFDSCDFGARAAVTAAADGSATFCVTIFGSD